MVDTVERPAMAVHEEHQATAVRTALLATVGEVMLPVEVEVTPAAVVEVTAVVVATPVGAEGIANRDDGRSTFLSP